MSAFRARRRLRSPPTARQRPAVRKPIPLRSRSTSASLARRRLRKPRTARRRPVGSSPIRWRTRGTSAFLARPSSRGFESLCGLLNRPGHRASREIAAPELFRPAQCLKNFALLAPWFRDSQWLDAAFDRLDRERHALQRHRIVAADAVEPVQRATARHPEVLRQRLEPAHPSGVSGDLFIALGPGGLTRIRPIVGE